MRLRSIIFLLLCTISFHLNAQFSNIRFKHLTTAEGLSDLALFCIFQDSKGWLWFGTGEGLSRYDGVEMTNWFNNKSDSNSLANNIVLSITEDKEGNIWTGGPGGLNVLRKKTGKLFRYPNQLAKAGGYPQCNSVFTLACSPKGSLWIGTLGGLLRYFPEKDSFALAFQPPFNNNPKSAAPFHRNCLDFDEKGNLYAFIGGKIYVSKNEGQSFDSVTMVRAGKTEMIPAFLEITGDKLVFAYQNISDLFVRDLKTGKQKSIRLCESDLNQFPPPIRIMHAARVNEEEIWVAASGDDNNKDYGGIIVLNNDFEIKDRLFADQSEPNTISLPWLLQILKDRQGTIWVATIHAADYYHPVFGNFRIYNKQNKNSKEIYATPAICSDKNDNIWLGSWDQGIAKLNKSTGDIREFRIPPSLSQNNNLNRINWIAADEKDMLWVNSEGGTIGFNMKNERFILNPDGKTIKVYEKKFNKIIPLKEQEARPDEFNLTKRVDSSPFGRALFLGNDTVWRYDYSRSVFVAVYPTKEFSRSTKGIHGIFPDPRPGQFWIFSKVPNRIVLVDLKSNKETIFNNPASEFGVNGILMLGDSALCIATEGDGFYYYSIKENKTSYFRIEDGLCSNQVKTICPGKDGTIWLGTYGGIALFDSRTKTFRNYLKQDGLFSEAVLHNSCQTSDGKIFFPTIKDIVCIDPEMITEQPSTFPPEIIRLKVAEKERFFNDLASPIHLTAEQNNFSAEFSSMNFVNPSSDEFQYQLEGYDKDWINAGNRRYANYTNLPGGTYVFKVRTRNGTRPWSNVSELHFRVDTIFFKTWWFIGIMLLVVAGLLYAFYRMRMNRLLAIEKMRQRFSRDLHDDIGSTLSSINILSKTSQSNKTTNNNSDHQVLEKIHQRSQKMLDAMDDIIWSTKPENDSVEDLTVRMHEYASETLEAAGIQYALNCPASLGKLKLNMEQKKNLFLIFKEAVNNLAKYSESRTAYISFGQNSSLLSLTVKDEGKGFSEKVRKGNGLQNMTNRATEIDAQLEIDSEPGKGTTIRVDLPL